MGASFSSALLENTASPVTAYPFTVGLWVRPTGSGEGCVWEISSTGVPATDYWNVYRVAGGTSYTFLAMGDAASITTAANADKWQFVLARAISATNRRLSVLDSNGAALHVQTVTSIAPASITTFRLGNFSDSSSPFAGTMAEFWYTNTDIQPGGAQLADITLRHLAYNGPFSMPHIAKDIVEYRSFLSSLGSQNDEPDEVFWGSRGRQVWATTGSPTVGLHVPLLLPTYRRPTDYHRMMMI